MSLPVRGPTVGIERDRDLFRALAAVFVSIGVLLGPASAQFDPAATEPIGKIRGSLVIVGGGTIPAAVADRFVELAGGRAAQIVVVPTASGRAEEPVAERDLDFWKKRGPASVAVLHTRDRERADDAEFAEPLTKATAVWFDGGDQTKITDAYVGTAVERAILDLLDRGGVIGGTSAGAAVMSRVMIAGGNPRARVATGFDLLPGSVVDQHFVARKRQERLRGVIAEHSKLVGFGIDEGTALVVRGRSIEVMGESTVTVCLAASETRAERFEELTAGQRADLIALSRAAVARSQTPFPLAEPPAPNVPNGSLVIVGGGGVPAGLMERFIELAGGTESPIVFIPCVPDDVIAREPGDVAMLRRAGAKNVTWLHTKDRRRSNSDHELLAPLREACGVWFGGGRQWNLVDSYQNTTAHKLMHDVLARGGAIGGSSAGASIQGDYMPRGDPLGNLNIIAEGYERGLGFLTGVAIDQHFTQRKRQPDMTLLMKSYPQLLGIGLDEGTAIVVRKNIAEVVGKNSVSFYDTRRAAEQDGDDHAALKEGQKYDLTARKVVDAN